jgi:hypothetical protein
LAYVRQPYVLIHSIVSSTYIPVDVDVLGRQLEENIRRYSEDKGIITLGTVGLWGFFVTSA